MNEELIWGLWNGEIIVSIINGEQGNCLDNLLVEFGFPMNIPYPFQENGENWDRLYYYFVSTRHLIEYSYPVFLVESKEKAIQKCSPYAEVLEYDTFIELLKDIFDESTLQDADVDTLI